jgi:hypothetical protein
MEVMGLILTGILNMPMAHDPGDIGVVEWQQIKAAMREADAEITRLREELAAMTAERDAAYAKGLEDALSAIADLPTGRTEDVMEGQEQAYRAVQACRAMIDTEGQNMSDMPDRIWHQNDTRGHREQMAEYAEKPVAEVLDCFTEYRRADAPLTPAEVMRLCPEVAALVADVKVISRSLGTVSTLAPFTEAQEPKN